MDHDILTNRLLGSYAIKPVHEDKSDLFMDKFIEWTKELGKDIYLFGHSRAAEKLIEKFPGAYKAIVDLDPAKRGQKIGNIPIISFPDYKVQAADPIIITDINYQYVYLDLLYYEILWPAHALTVEGIWNFRIRYNYELGDISYSNNPEVFDYDYLSIKRSLPMACTIPSDSIIRLIDCIKATADVEGDVVEVGTGEGGSTYYMASIMEAYAINKTIYSADGFDPQDYIPNLSYEAVLKNLARFPFVKLMKGHAPGIFKSSPIKSIAFAFIDFFALPDIIEDLYPKIPAGGIILIDNYNHGCYHNHGMPLANAFFLDKKEKIIRVGGTQGMIVKQWELSGMVDFTQFRSFSKYERKVDIKKLRFIYDAVCGYATDAAVDTAELKILEVGCGDGSITLPLSLFNGTVRAFDLDEDLVAGVKRAVDKQGITNIIVDRDDAYTFDAHGEKYDVIVVSEVLEHTDQPADIVAKLKTHLAPGGILITTVPNGFGPWELKNKFLKLVKLNTTKDKECGHHHVQFFTFGSFTRMINEHGLLLVGFAKSDVLSGLSYHASKNGIVAGIDLALADLLPLWMASGWYFVFKNR